MLKCAVCCAESVSVPDLRGISNLLDEKCLRVMLYYMNNVKIVVLHESSMINKEIGLSIQKSCNDKYLLLSGQQKRLRFEFITLHEKLN